MLLGAAGNDTLDGGAGADSLGGGAGDDTFVVDNTADVVTESSGQGTDTVRASIAWTLGANVENLTLTGTAPINGTGNSFINLLTGNAAANSLSGLAGDDTFVGGGGADFLNGGIGNDMFDYNAASDSSTAARDTLAGFDGAGTGPGDRIDLADLYAGTLTFLANGAAFTGLGQVHVIEAGGGNSLIEVNLTGSLAADFAILVQDGSTAAMAWRAADFLL